jgi:hypothetical protein
MKIKLIGSSDPVVFKQAVTKSPLAIIGHKQRRMKSGDNLPSPIQIDANRDPTPAAAVAVANA